MGARPMARVIQDKVKRALADELLFGKLAAAARSASTCARASSSVEAEAEPEKLLPVTV